MICQHCNSTNVKLRRVLAKNGVSMVAWRCLRCDRWASKTPQWLPKAAVDQLLSDWNRRKPYQVTLDMIPVIGDYRMPCQVCSAAESEWHHWFPTAIRAALESMDVPSEHLARWEGFQVRLCSECHRLWHEAVTWYLPGFNAGPISASMRERFEMKSKA